MAIRVQTILFYHLTLLESPKNQATALKTPDLELCASSKMAIRVPTILFYHLTLLESPKNQDTALKTPDLELGELDRSVKMVQSFVVMK